MSNLYTDLKDVVGPQGYREGADIEERSYKDLMGARKSRPALHLRPASTDEVSRILALCHQHDQPLVPQGGMTGLVSAAAPREGEISLSLERMNRITEVDAFSATMTVEAGAPLQKIQEAADEQALLFPLDLGARGSCTIGGNLATNAGGNRVIRYGMARELVVGLEAVLADGTVINDLHKLRKNNTGLDLKQLFIGSEGTLGVITGAVLKLYPRPRSQIVALCAVEDFQQVSELLVTMQASLGGNLTAFEVLWQNTYQLMQQHVPHVQLPFDADHGFYVLIESMGSSAEADRRLFDEAMETAMEAGLVQDGVISQSDKDIDNLWAVRDGATEIPRSVGRMHAYDVSLAIQDMDYFGSEVVSRLQTHWPEATISLFGHIGDGNLHVLVHAGPNNRELHDAIDEVIYTLVKELHGSISAEHGIGMMKRPYLSYSRSPAEITLMETVKQALDPKGILSPGRVVDV